MLCFAKYVPLFPASVTSNELVFLQPVEYNSYFAGACISWRRDANGGEWQPHYRITDHLGSTRLETSSNGTINAAYDYKPFGEQIPLMTSKTRKTYIGKERDEESYLGDFGVRKYDYAAGRFTSPDVLWEKYMTWSPYQYCKNNPISSRDGNGMVVIGISGDEQQAILDLIPSNLQSYVEFGEDGSINQDLINSITEVDGNFGKLQTMVNSKTTYSVNIASEFEAIDNSGNEVLTSLGNISFDPRDPGVYALSTNEVGWQGYTAIPGKSGGLNSINGNVNIFINKQLTRNGRAETTAHELFGHGLAFDKGLNPDHEPDKNFLDTNYPLRSLIIESIKETQLNMNGGRK